MRNEHMLSNAFFRNVEEPAKSAILHPVVLQADPERFGGDHY